MERGLRASSQSGDLFGSSSLAIDVHRITAVMPPIPPQDLHPRVTWPSSIAALTTLPPPPQTAARPLTSWPLPQQRITQKSRPCSLRSIPPPTAPTAQAHMIYPLDSSHWCQTSHQPARVCRSQQMAPLSFMLQPWFECQQKSHEQELLRQEVCPCFHCHTCSSWRPGKSHQ